MKISLLKCESGSMLVVLPLIVAMTVGMAVMWNWAKMGTNVAQAIKADAEVEKVAANVYGRVKTALTTNVAACGGGTNAQFLALRNLASQAASVTATYTRAPSVNTFDACLLPTSDSSNNSFIGEVDLEIRRLSVPDRVHLSSTVSVVVRAISRTDSGEAVKKVTLSKTITLKAARLSDYVLVLKNKTNYAGGQITVSAGTQTVRFMSPVLEAHPTNTTLAVTGGGVSPLVNNTAGAIYFDKPFSTRARALTGFANPDLAVVKNIFRGGVRLSVLDGQVITNGLPFEDNGVTNNAWDQNVVYNRVGNTVVPSADLSGTHATPIENGIGQAIGTDALPNPGLQPVSYPDGTLFVGGAAPNLSYSCAAQTEYVMNAQLIYNQSPQTVTIDMNGNTADAGLVCGLINADTVVFDISAGANYFIGTIIANRIQITGAANGSMTFINPYDTSIVPPTAVITGLASLPTLQTFAALKLQFDAQAFAGPGRNFLQPVMRFTPPLESAEASYRPGGMVTARYGTIAGGPFNGSALMTGGFLGPTSNLFLTAINNSTGRWPSGELSFVRTVSTDILGGININSLDTAAALNTANANDTDGFGDTSAVSYTAYGGTYNDNFVFVAQEAK